MLMTDISVALGYGSKYNEHARYALSKWHTFSSDAFTEKNGRGWERGCGLRPGGSHSNISAGSLF